MKLGDVFALGRLRADRGRRRFRVRASRLSCAWDASAATTETATKTQVLLARLTLVLVVALVVAGVAWYGVSAKEFQRVWQNILARPGGPMTFRFLLQPAMAAVAALHDGRRDARLGRSPYAWTLLTDAADRCGRLREGVISTARIILLGLAMDAIYQVSVLKSFYPAEAVIVALLLAFIPYVLLRGPLSRIARWWCGGCHRGQGRVTHHARNLAGAHQESGAGTASADSTLFEGGAPLGLQRRLGLVGDGNLHVVRRAALVVAIGWLPIVLLAIVQSALFRTDGIGSLIWGIEAHARYLLAAPLLIFAETECAVRLSVIVRHFVSTGVVRDNERLRFDTAIASTRRLLGSTTVEIAVVVLAYAITAAMALSTPFEQVPAWHRPEGALPIYSPAGWWHVVVSLPLLLMLFLGWIWRLAAWARLLWLISRLHLRLVASHPDHVAGLGFVGHSLRAFAIVALAPMMIAAARSAHAVLIGASLPTSHLVFNISLLLSVVAVVTAPLLVFTPTLIHVWRRAAFEYGALAARTGIAFEDKWLRRDQLVDQIVLEQQDFSATTDLYAVVANIYELRFICIDVKSLVILVGTMLLPFVPIVLLAISLNDILAGLKSLLF